jgi:hypothetical protein
VVEIALELLIADVWTDIACDASQASWSWGTSEDGGVTTLPNAANAQLRINDDRRRFDPDNPGSDLYGYLDLRTRGRIRLDGRVAFTGYVDSVVHDLAQATITLTDTITALVAIKFPETSRPAESTSSRVNAILDAAGVRPELRDIEPGGVVLQAGTYSSDAWTEIAAVTRNELGAVWTDPNAVVHWRTRATAWAARTPTIVLGCAPSDAPAGALELGRSPETLRNDLSIARRGGTARAFRDDASITRYGRYGFVQHDLEVSTDGDRDFWAAFYLDRQAIPTHGVSKVAVPAPPPAFVSELLAAPFGEGVRYQDDGHYGDPFTADGRLLGWAWTAQPDTMTVTLGLGAMRAIGLRDRFLSIDTPAEWTAATAAGGTNVRAAEPGLTVDVYPGYAAPALLARPAPDDRPEIEPLEEPEP